jgi:hypothetical protein
MPSSTHTVLSSWTERSIASRRPFTKCRAGGALIVLLSRPVAACRVMSAPTLGGAAAGRGSGSGPARATIEEVLRTPILSRSGREERDCETWLRFLRADMWPAWHGSSASCAAFEMAMPTCLRR